MHEQVETGAPGPMPLPLPPPLPLPLPGRLLVQRGKNFAIFEKTLLLFIQILYVFPCGGGYWLRVTAQSYTKHKSRLAQSLG